MNNTTKKNSSERKTLENKHTKSTKTTTTIIAQIMSNKTENWFIKSFSSSNRKKARGRQQPHEKNVKNELRLLRFWYYNNKCLWLFLLLYFFFVSFQFFLSFSLPLSHTRTQCSSFWFRVVAISFLYFCTKFFFLLKSVSLFYPKNLHLISK